MPKKEKTDILTIFGIILVPAALFWILYRHGFFAIIDSFAVGILAAAALLFGLRWLWRKKIIKLGKN